MRTAQALWGLAPIVVVLALMGAVFSACGGDDDDSTARPSTDLSLLYTAPASAQPAGYDYQSDPALTPAERSYITDSIRGGALQQIDRTSLESEITGPSQARIMADRGDLACDGLREGKTRDQMVQLGVDFGGQTYAQSAAVVVAAIIHLCPEFTGTG